MTSRKVTPAIGTALEDLGIADAAELSTKVQLAVQINQIIAGRHLKQNQVKDLLGVSQGNVSALINYKLDGFSVERLLRFLNALDRDVEIRVKKKPRTRDVAQTTVVHA